MLTEETVTTLTLTCDGPLLGASCPTPPLKETTESGLLKIMRGMGWRLPDLDGNGRIDRAQPCYCRDCVRVLEAAGKLAAT